MSGSENIEEDTITFEELYDFETRNLAGCDNDDTCCTFPKGYVYRQALFHCLTCKDISGKQSGICYPCSVHCHAGHILEDLYTKRNFRCDCGNSNFTSDFRCKLWEEKDDVNIKNKYNHNFSGLYCVCDIKYDEGRDTEEMIQCVVCEDWYHLKHLSGNDTKDIKSNDLENYEEFICKICLKNHDYLNVYNRAFVNNLLGTEETKIEENDSFDCKLVMIKLSLDKLGDEALQVRSCGALCTNEWRKNLCRCDNCVKMMMADGTNYLLEEKDSMEYYYAAMQPEDDIKEELSNLPYSQAIILAEGIAIMKQEFNSFLSSIDPSKVITAADINNCFDKMKRRRLDKPE